MDFGLMFFASRTGAADGRLYAPMIEAARAADRYGFCCVWTPERHFDIFGGLFPNPAITSAALASITERVQLRAGSCISPLHDTVRLAEDWAMVDNLSGGRVALSFGSGWNVNDFVFYPERYASRHAVMLDQLAQIRALWRGQSIVRRNSAGKDVAITLQPPPVQRELPVWLTSSGNPRTFAAAGTHGANVLTHLIGQDLDALAGKIECYRRARRDAGFAPEAGIVSLMLHTYVTDDRDRARAAAWGPLREYLRAAADLEKRAARGGGSISGGLQLPDSPADDEASDELTDELLSLTCERYLDSGSLIGSVESCGAMVDRLIAIGVNEVACLIDFGLPDRDVLEGLGPLNHLRERCAAPVAAGAGVTAGPRGATQS